MNKNNNKTTTIVCVYVCMFLCVEVGQQCLCSRVLVDVINYCGMKHE